MSSRLFLTAVVCSALFSSEVLKAESAGVVATLDTIEGKVEKRSSTSTDFGAASIGTTFLKMDVIHTNRASRAGVVFANGVLLRIAPNTTLEFHGAGNEGVAMPEGRAYLFSRAEKDLPVVETPSVSAAIRGTEVEIEASKTHTSVTVLDGVVECHNKYGSVTLHRGEQAEADPKHAPIKRVIAHPENAVAWALNYPWVIDESGFEGATKSTLARARYALEHGEVEQSAALLQPLLSSTDKRLQANVVSQQAVVAIVTNDLTQAKALSDEAASLCPSCSSVALAQSYLAQANFEVAEARTIVTSALHQGRGSAEGQSVLTFRAAELALASGDSKEAERLIATAATGDDLVLRGFIYLFRNEVESAERAFIAASARTPGDGMPHLGRALALIRHGKLAAGREELKRAVYLEPNVSLYRSYLGKAYFESDDETRALHEYDQAIALDPNDPTPYLYRSFAELSLNRPVRALKDVEAAVERNDKRAVFRSRLLLDEDAAVRSAKLSQIYTTLGFEDLARVEAVRSLSKDYENFSAHRLLSESYQAGFVVLDDASRSERRIANLLSPLSLNLLNEADAGTNDYNAMFDKVEERTFFSTGYERINDVVSSSVTTGGRTDEFGYGASVDAQLSNGRAHNGFSHLYRASTIFQYEPTSEHRLLFSYDGDYVKQSELGAYDQFSQEESNFSLGYHAKLLPDLHSLTEVGYRNPRKDLIAREVDRDILVQLDDLEGETDFLIDEISRERTKAFFADEQLIYHTTWLSMVSGVEGVWNRPSREEISPIIDGDEELAALVDNTLRSHGYNDLASGSYYAYPTFHLTDWLDVTAGASFSEIQYEVREIEPFVSRARSRSALLPKIGLVLTPLTGTTVRAAYLEGLRKSSLEDTSTLEPTLVGGINQIFTDVSGARSRLWGVGIDQKLSSGTFFGIEGTRRHLIEPITAAESLIRIGEEETKTLVALDQELDDHQSIDTARAYVSQLLNDRWVASLKHEWDQEQAGDLEDFPKLSLHRTEMALRYFDPSGFFAEAGATRREQKRRNSFLEDGRDAFWTVDAGVGYRLPHRHGSVALKITNLLDENFTYDQSAVSEEPISQDLGVLAAASFNF